MATSSSGRAHNPLEGSTGFFAWAESDYPCDRALWAHTQFEQIPSGSPDRNTYAVPTNIRNVSENLARWVGLIDVISQVGKIVLELAMWPFFAITCLGYAWVYLPIQACKNQIPSFWKDCIVLPLLSIGYSPISVLYRLYFIAVDILGVIGCLAPKTIAVQRHDAFSSLYTGASLLRFISNTLWGSSHDANQPIST